MDEKYIYPFIVYNEMYGYTVVVHSLANLPEKRFIFNMCSFNLFLFFFSTGYPLSFSESNKEGTSF